MDFLIVNGKVVSKKEANLTSFLWGEPLIISQKVWFGFGGIPLFDENLKAIKIQFDSFNIPLPALFKNKRELFRLTKRMLNKNKFYRSGFVNFQFFISNKQKNSLITSEAFSDFDFPYSEQGLLCNISEIKKNSAQSFGCFKCYNQVLWKSAKAQLKDLIQTGAILLNEKDMVCEGVASNIFMLKDNVLITPALNTGCYEDVLRPVILKLVKESKFKIIETDEFEAKHLAQMDEIFFASEENGIQWVLGIDKKRFVHEVSGKIYQKLNDYLKARVAD